MAINMAYSSVTIAFTGPRRVAMCLHLAGRYAPRFREATPAFLCEELT